jgi:mono/diheme cytochrome c family protein
MGTRTHLPGVCRAVLGGALALLALLPVARAEPSAEKGREIALKHCIRCHVVDPARKYTGIDSTPSFMLLAKRPDFVERFESFYTRRPHPAFVNVPDLTPARTQPTYTVEFEMTLEDIDNILAYARTLRK